MLKRIILVCITFMFTFQLCAQHIETGTYLGIDSDEFVVVSDDSICFRLQTDCINNLFVIGKGTYKCCHGKLRVKLSEDLYPTTSSLMIMPRQDSLFSFRIKHSDGTPLKDGLVIVESIGSKGELVLETDSAGFVNVASMSSFLDSEVYVGTYLNLDISDMRQMVLLKRGFDYTMTSNIPSSLVCGICKEKRIRYDFEILEDGSIEFVFEYGGFPRESCCSSKLVRVSESYELSTKYFEKHVGAILMELNFPKEK